MVKWKNIDIGPAYYYITGTITEWLPLLNRPDIRQIVYDDIKVAVNELNATIAAFVIMPEHLHLLVFLPDEGILHKFNKKWRGRSGRHIAELLVKQNDKDILTVLAKHANGKCKHAIWKEQPRALPIWKKEKLYAKIDYIHANPVRRKLVESPGDWEHSSWRYYERGESVGLDIGPLLI